MKIITPATFSKYIAPLDSDYTNYLSRLQTFGGSITAPHSAAIQSFVATLKSSTLWANSILLAPLAGNTFNSALVPLKTPIGSNSEFTSSTNPTYSTAAGMTYVTGSEVISTKVIANTHLSLSNFAVWAYTPTTNPSITSLLISTSTGASIELVLMNGTGLPSINASRTAAITASPAPSIKNGLYGGISNPSGQELWLRGTQIAQAATTTTPLTAAEIQIGRRATTTITHVNPFSVGFVAITTALSPSDIVAFTNAVSTLMTGLGR